MAYSCCNQYKLSTFGVQVPAQRTPMLLNSRFSLHHLSAFFVDSTDYYYVGRIVCLRLHPVQPQMYPSTSERLSRRRGTRLGWPKDSKLIFNWLRRACPRRRFDKSGTFETSLAVDYYLPASGFSRAILVNRRSSPRGSLARCDAAAVCPSINCLEPLLFLPKYLHRRPPFA